MKGNERRPRRQFSKAFKAEVVELCLSEGRSIGKVAAEMDLTETAVRRWVAQSAHKAGGNAEEQETEREELRRLRRENRMLREERDILKRAMSFFARETR